MTTVQLSPYYHSSPHSLVFRQIEVLRRVKKLQDLVFSKSNITLVMANLLWDTGYPLNMRNQMDALVNEVKVNLGAGLKTAKEKIANGENAIKQRDADIAKKDEAIKQLSDKNNAITTKITDLEKAKSIAENKVTQVESEKTAAETRVAQLEKSLTDLSKQKQDEIDAINEQKKKDVDELNKQKKNEIDELNKLLQECQAKLTTDTAAKADFEQKKLNLENKRKKEDERLETERKNRDAAAETKRQADEEKLRQANEAAEIERKKQAPLNNAPKGATSVPETTDTTGIPKSTGTSTPAGSTGIPESKGDDYDSIMRYLLGGVASIPTTLAEFESSIRSLATTRNDYIFGNPIDTTTKKLKHNSSYLYATKLNTLRDEVYKILNASIQKITVNKQETTVKGITNDLFKTRYHPDHVTSNTFMATILYIQFLGASTTKGTKAGDTMKAQLIDMIPFTLPAILWLINQLMTAHSKSTMIEIPLEEIRHAIVFRTMFTPAVSKTNLNPLPYEREVLDVGFKTDSVDVKRQKLQKTITNWNWHLTYVLTQFGFPNVTADSASLKIFFDPWPKIKGVDVNDAGNDIVGFQLQENSYV